MLTPVESTRIDLESVQLFAERFAVDTSFDRSTAVLLLSAAEAPSTRWPPELIESFTAEIGQVIRFDTRDSGRSSDADHGYTLDDLSADAVGVIDHFGVQTVHVVGRSMGAMVAQVLALEHAKRVLTLSLLSSTAGLSDAHGTPAPWFVERMAERLLCGPPVSHEERIEWIVEQQTWFAGGRYRFDRDDAMGWASAEVDAFWHDDVGHGRAVVESESRYHRLQEIECPAMIVHGTADPVYPVAHGQALAAGIPSSELHLVEQLGHELPDAFAPELADLLIRFWRRSARV